MNQSKTYTGTFTKRNGQTRTMTFVKSADIPQSLSPNQYINLFNHNTVVCQVTQNNVTFSFDKIS